MNKYFRDLKTYREIILNIEFLKTETIGLAEQELLKLNQRLKREAKVYCANILYDPEKINFLPIPKAFNAVIIDLEGQDPLKVFGLLLRNRILTYSLKDEGLKSFYSVIIKILKFLKNVLIFTFSFWDIDILLSIRDHCIRIFGHSKSQSNFMEEFKYFNLQDYDKESISAALYSLGEDIPKDPLYRKSYQINRLYEDGFYKTVQDHNLSCFKCESIIFLKRFVKNHIIDKSVMCQIYDY